MGQPMTKTKSTLLQCITPVDGSVYVERALNTASDINTALDKAKKAQKSWRNVPLAEKQKIVLKALDYFLANANDIATEISWMIGRPVSQTPGEINRGFQERIRYMVELAPQALADITPAAREGFTRYIKREALGVVAIIAPWNYPYLTSSNGIMPALLAGNAVILKNSHQTPLCADRYTAAFKAAGLPDGVFQCLDLSHEDTEKMIADARVDYVAFTGSVNGGHAIQRAISNKFINAGLELGGKDPAYVRPDANMKDAIENLVDGSFFNSGQSCCGIERIYVHEKVYKEFVDGFVDLTKSSYKLGNPLEAGINLGPMVRTAAASFVRAQTEEAIKSGAKALIDEKLFAASKSGTPYLAPQVLVDVNHSMRAMTEETFGPVVGIMKVSSDDEALKLMNDSAYGLTASIWTADVSAAQKIGHDLETGTVFMNRCDYVDPGLPWTGVKDTGRGATLSSFGFDNLTRPKGFHLKTKV